MKHRPLVLGLALAVIATPLTALPAQAADAAVTGIVTVDGVPVADTEVGWFDPTTRAAGETRTSATGAYSLSVADGHPFVLYAGVDYSAAGDANHKESATWTSLGGANYVPGFQGIDGVPDYLYQGRPLFPAGTGAVTANIDLDKPGAITPTLAALAGRTVWATTTYGLRLAKGKADAAGSVTIAGLIPGTYQLTVPGLANGVEFQSQSVTVTAGQTSSFVPVFPTKEKGRIRGVVTSNHRPVKNIVVSVSGSTARTDAKGRYSIGGLKAGTYTLRFNTGEEYFPSNKWVTTSGAEVKLAKDATKTINSSLTVGGTVTATVTGVTNKTGLNITLTNAKGAIVLGRYFEVKSSRSTAAVVPGIPAGSYTAYFTSGANKVYAKRSVTVRLGQTIALGAVALDQPTITVSGRTIGSKNAFIGSSGLSFYGYSLATGKNGRYRLAGLIPGQKGSITVGDGRHVDRRIPFTVGTRSITKNLRLGAKFGTIRTELTVAGYPVIVGSIEISKKGDFEDALQIKNDGTATRLFRPGKARIQLVPDRASFYQFVANAPFWISIPSSAQVVTVTSGKVTDTGPIALEIHR